VHGGEEKSVATASPRFARAFLDGETFRERRDREDEAACAAFAAIDEITLRPATNNLAEILFYGVLSLVRNSNDEAAYGDAFEFLVYIYIYTIYICT